MGKGAPYLSGYFLLYGATVGLTTRLSMERDQGGSIFIGRFVEAIRETLIRRDVLGIL